MKIGIDCRLSGIAHAGIGRYIENLISRLPIMAPAINWVFFYSSPDQILPSLKNQSHVKWVHVPIKHYSLQEQLRLPAIFNHQNLDLLHVPHFNIPVMYPGKIAVTIHDLLWHEQRGSHVTTLQPWLYWLKYLAYKFVASQAVKKASQIIVPTQTIKKTLTNYYPHAASKTNVTYEGVGSELLSYRNIKVHKNQKSLLYVGSLYPHKNLNLILKALQELPTWRLTIVGSRNVFQEQVNQQAKKMKVIKQVKFAGYLEDQVLARHIKASTALVQPSFSEGFGLTGIEAMALGTPVLASDIPVFKEIYQDAAVYFDPQSTTSFIKALTKKLPSQKKMRSVVKQYSWDEMARQTLIIYPHET